MVTMARAQYHSSLLVMVTLERLTMPLTAVLLGLYRLPCPLPDKGVRMNAFIRLEGLL